MSFLWLLESHFFRTLDTEKVLQFYGLTFMLKERGGNSSGFPNVQLVNCIWNSEPCIITAWLERVVRRLTVVHTQSFWRAWWFEYFLPVLITVVESLVPFLSQYFSPISFLAVRGSETHSKTRRLWWNELCPPRAFSCYSDLNWKRLLAKTRQRNDDMSGPPNK